jgi:hypothetical protein
MTVYQLAVSVHVVNAIMCVITAVVSVLMEIKP